MATYLEKYQTKKSAYQDLLSQGQSLSSKELCFCMEAIYRAQVLETLSLLERTCPTVQDLSAFELHARLVSGIFGRFIGRTAVSDIQRQKNSKRTSGCLSVLFFLFQ